MTTDTVKARAGERVSPVLLGRDRAPFIPSVFWHGDNDDIRVDRAADPALWESIVDADTVIVTQWNDGDDAPARGRLPTCSCSMPSTVARMLDALDVREGQRVLEIGTGTGYTAALLKDRVGPGGSVVSVEVDAGLADTARTNLAAVGTDVQLVTGDGLDGHADGAPYDRVFVTCGIREVPGRWIEQTAVGGLVVLPWATAYATGHDVLLPLVVGPDQTACGRFADGLSYMKARSQRIVWPTFPDDWVARSDLREARVPAAWVEGVLTGFSAAVVGFMLPGVVKSVEDHDGSRNVYLYRQDRDGLSCAAVSYSREDVRVSTATFGPHDLAAEFLAALVWFRDHGRPEPEGFGLRVTADGGTARQAVWFGSDERCVDLRDVAVPWIT